MRASVELEKRAAKSTAFIMEGTNKSQDALLCFPGVGLESRLLRAFADEIGWLFFCDLCSPNSAKKVKKTTCATGRF